MPIANPVMLATTRQARGLTQAELAGRAELSQALISKAESGIAEIAGERLEHVASVLGYPASLLALPAEEHALVSTCVFHRKRSSLPLSKARQVHAWLDLARVQAEELLRDLPVLDVRLLRVSPSEDADIGPRDIAEQIRGVLGLAPGPVQDLTAAIEDAGAVIVSWDLGNRKVDAVSQWLDGHRPIILSNSAAPGDRQRFSLAHELGHAVMHPGPVHQQEDQADRFASALLMPGNGIRAELANLDMPSLARLKSRWGVSMAALIRRARDLGTISEYRYKELNIELSKAGWRTREPVDVRPERPTLLADAITRLRDKGLDDSAIAARAHLNVSDLMTLCGLQEVR